MITWNLAEARKVATAKQHKGPVWSLSYSAGTGDLLASGDAILSFLLPPSCRIRS